MCMDYNLCTEFVILAMGCFTHLPFEASQQDILFVSSFYWNEVKLYFAPLMLDWTSVKCNQTIRKKEKQYKLKCPENNVLNPTMLRGEGAVSAHHPKFILKGIFGEGPWSKNQVFAVIQSSDLLAK